MSGNDQIGVKTPSQELAEINFNDMANTARSYAQLALQAADEGSNETVAKPQRPTLTLVPRTEAFDSNKTEITGQREKPALYLVPKTEALKPC